ncbi:Kcnh7 [Symbiodinium microadriaticum]|nr:Kcnh7 [Symbiodinium microadriaticum]
MHAMELDQCADLAALLAQGEENHELARRFGSVASSPPQLEPEALNASYTEDFDAGARDRWDDDAENCSICSALLGRRRLRPRHHCRICGRCVCATCHQKEGQEEEKSKLRRKIEELRQAAGSAKNEVRKENSELSDVEDLDTGLVHVKSASKGSGGVVKQPRMSQSSLASGGSPMRLSLRNFSEQDGEAGTTPSPRASGSGMLFGMVPSSPSAPRASSSSRKVAPAPVQAASSRGRRNSAMLIPGVPAPKTPDPKKPSFGAPSLGAQTPPFTPRSSNGAHQSPQQSRARRGATVGLGGFTGEEVKLLPVWSKSTQGLAARVNVRSANAGMKDAEDRLSEVFGLLLIIYDLIWLPMQVFDSTDSQFTFATGVLSSIYWTFDIPLSFLVGFAIQDQGVIEKDLKKIAWNYCTGWLSLDLAIVTIDWVINFLDWTSSSSVSAGEGISFFRIGKAVRFLRLLRLLRLLRAHGRLNELLEHVQSEIAFIMLLNHMVACAWFWIGLLNRPDTWLLQADSDILVAPMAYQYFTALHWSLTQFTPASMEVVPKNEIERLFNVVVIISAMVIFSTFISAITNAMNQLRNLNSDTAAHLSWTRASFRNLSPITLCIPGERNEQAALLRRYMQQYPNVA